MESFLSSSDTWSGPIQVIISSGSHNEEMDLRIYCTQDKFAAARLTQSELNGIVWITGQSETIVEE